LSFGSAARLKISYERAPTDSVERALKLSVMSPPGCRLWAEG